jgi:hypothetical protein
VWVATFYTPVIFLLAVPRDGEGTAPVHFMLLYIRGWFLFFFFAFSAEMNFEQQDLNSLDHYKNRMLRTD